VATEKGRRKTKKEKKKLIIKIRVYYSISSRLAANFIIFLFFNFLKTQLSYVFWGEGWGGEYITNCPLGNKSHYSRLQGHTWGAFKFNDEALMRWVSALVRQSELNTLRFI
jgi:hypothetical protein